MIFKHWKYCSQNLIPLAVDESRIYYIQSQAWALKGYLGGTHSLLAFFSDQHDVWCVVEYTDRETLHYQDGQILYDKDINTDDISRSPYISTRSYNAEWFGHRPYIVDSCPTVSYKSVLSACEDFPYNEFRLLDLNCNTFTSYMCWKLNLDLKRPIRSIGFRNKKYWTKTCLK